MIDKIKKIIKRYWFFAFLVIPIITISFENKYPTNDIWFLLNCGRYVLNKGIPYIDPFTIHDGLNYVMQQWGSASILWSFFNIGKETGLIVFLYVTSFLLMITFYKLCKTVSNKRILSIVLTTITFTLISEYIVHRPQIFTYLILLLEILFLELYVHKNNYKYLVPLPILSVLLINMHCTMWYFLFVFMLPFLVNAFYIKKFTIDKYSIKPLLIILLLMFICGFINPYGVGAISFIFKSYGLDLVNMNLNEMMAPSFQNMHSNYMYIGTALVICLILCLNFLKKVKFDVRHICFILGTLLLFLMHAKCFPLFIFAILYSFAYGCKKVKTIKFKKIWIVNILKIVKSLAIGVAVMLFFTFFVFAINYKDTFYFHPYVNFPSDCEIMADYIIDNYNQEEVVLFVEYDYGGYYQYRGFKTYMDPRAELFYKSNNGKDEIFIESYDLRVNPKFKYEEFIDKYKFTHFIVDVDSLFDKYLKSNDKYSLVHYTSYDSIEGLKTYQNLYVFKETKVEES